MSAQVLTPLEPLATKDALERPQIAMLQGVPGQVFSSFEGFQAKVTLERPQILVPHFVPLEMVSSLEDFVAFFAFVHFFRLAFAFKRVNLLIWLLRPQGIGKEFLLFHLHFHIFSFVSNVLFFYSVLVYGTFKKRKSRNLPLMLKFLLCFDSQYGSIFVIATAHCAQTMIIIY